METAVNELISMLRPDLPFKVKVNATEIALRFTGDKEGGRIIKENKKFLEAVLTLVRDESAVVAGNAYSMLINLCSDEWFGFQLIMEYNLLPTFIEHIVDVESCLADKSCMIMCNLTRTSSAAAQVTEAVCKDGNLKKLITAFCTIEYNKKKCTLDYLAPLFANLMQLEMARKVLLDKNEDFFKKLLSFLGDTKADIRRGGVASVVRNCCFQFEHHDWMLDPKDINILPSLLYPLAGGEEYSDEIMDSFPVELQYLDEDKPREIDPDIRKFLVESLTLLCTKLRGREMMRELNVHLLIEKFMEWETKNGERPNVQSAEALIQTLVSKEDEGIDNLMTDVKDEEVQKKDEEKVEELEE